MKGSWICNNACPECQDNVSCSYDSDGPEDQSILWNCTSCGKHGTGAYIDNKNVFNSFEGSPGYTPPNSGSPLG